MRTACSWWWMAYRAYIARIGKPMRLWSSAGGPRSARTFQVTTLHYILSLAVIASVGCAPPREGKLSNNGLVLDMNALDLLSTQAFAHSQGDNLLLNEDDFGDLLAAEGGPALIKYLTTCALDEGTTLTVESTGETYEGNLGLATDWVDDSCGTSCQRWVSACIMAHANAFGNPVTISPRGKHESLRWSDGFTYEEAAYYGNLFLGADRVLAACGGKNILGTQDLTEETIDEQPVADFLNGRLCGTGSCGLVFAGVCRFVVPGVATVGACNEYEDGVHSACQMSEDADGLGIDPGYPVYEEVITVFLDQ